MGRILIGISSWADADLVRSGFYPAGVNTAEGRLAYYSSKFNVTEIDSSYHFFPTQRNLALWLDNTPTGFTFDVKVFSLFTGQPTALTSFPRSIREKYAGQIQAKGNIYLHHLPAAAIDELWGITIQTMEAFRAAGKLGTVLFQFPPWFHSEPKNYDYIDSCWQRLAGFPLAVEFQISGWLHHNLEVTLKILRERHIALVCVDEPQGLKSSVPSVAEVTAPLSIIRFHGRNKENWENKGGAAAGRFDYLYSEEELKAWLPGIKAIAGQADILHIIFKNKHADYPVKNAAMMQKLLGLI